MKSRREKFVLVLVVVGTAALSSSAGNLNPPAGVVAPTMKALNVVEPRTPISSLPFTITQAGSYYLTGNLSTASNGILVNTSDVTIDMMGFTITGSTPDNHNGIEVNSNHRGNFTLRNGAVRRFRNGVYAPNTAGLSEGASVIGVSALEIGLTGIEVRSRNGLVRDCRVAWATETTLTNSTGIAVAGGVIQSCNASRFSVGIGGIDGAVIQDCVAIDCGVGLYCSAGVVRGCAARNSTTQSLLLASGAVAFENYVP